MSHQPRIRITDPRLFGNDAAESEQDESLFLDQSVSRSEHDEFLDDAWPIRIVQALKGEGKSALLRLTELTLRQRGEPFVTRITAHAIAPKVGTLNHDEWVNAWKVQLVNALAHAVASGINVAWNDDGMSLLELAERTGFRQKSFVGAILTRLQGPALPLNVVPGQTKDLTPALERTLEDRPAWLIVDDIDDNFKNDAHDRVRAASFFTAARLICDRIPSVRIRASVRPTAWTIFEREYEGLSKLGQDCRIDLRWTYGEIGHLLAKRIEVPHRLFEREAAAGRQIRTPLVLRCAALNGDSRGRSKGREVGDSPGLPAGARDARSFWADPAATKLGNSAKDP